jgi:hypothetical protein
MGLIIRGNLVLRRSPNDLIWHKIKKKLKIKG